MIETKAIRSGTTARNEAKTKIRTKSAPNPPMSASIRRLGPSASSPESSNSASKPVRWTCDPPTVAPSTALLAAFSAAGFSPKAESGSGWG